MKNNWIQYLSFGLCAIMLIIIIVQGKKLDAYDKDNHCLKAEVSVSLKEWYEDTAVE